MSERLLLMVSAAGEPPDARLMDKSGIFIAHWTGTEFRPLKAEYPIGWELKVTHWAKTLCELSKRSLCNLALTRPITSAA